MTSLSNAVVLITGAGGGFGQHLIRQCLAKSARLIVTDVDGNPLSDCVKAIQSEVSTGVVLQCISADLSSREGCEALAAAAVQIPDVLINNAGVACYGRFDEIPVEQWERLMHVNLLAPMYLTSLFAPKMIARRSGHIVNISSVAGWIGTGGLSAYSASKFGLRGFGESLLEDLREFNIHVTTVYPFFSRTPILHAPRFGSIKNRDLPNNLTTDPANVVREIIQGIEKNKAHIFPDHFAKLLQRLKRFVPGIVPVMNRQMEDRLSNKS